MSSIGTRLLVVVALLCACAPATASAQIYSWRDADGTLVLSTTPRAGATKTYAVANTAAPIRATRAVYSRRVKAFEPIIAASAAEHNIRPDLVRAVIQAESAFNPLARSHKGAMGLMQLMPATATELGVTDPYDPEQNIRGGVAYLKSLLVQFAHNEELALAAYNAGPTAVNKYDGVPPYRETRNYVAKIRNQAAIHTAPPTRIERTVEVVNGRKIVTFTNKQTKR